MYCHSSIFFALALLAAAAVQVQCFVPLGSRVGDWGHSATVKTCYSKSGTCPRSAWQLHAIDEDQEEPKIRSEYAALEPGTLVKIQVGDVALSRKAWKKRRRSGSPLLVPCSVLDMDRESMVRWNILYLLQKFGSPLKDLGLTGRGVALSFSDVTKLYKHHLGTSLNKHAQALGCQSSRALFRYLFNAEVQKEYGLRVVQPKSDSNKNDDTLPMWLVIPISRHRARDMASQAGLVQFQASPDDKKETGPRMRHTGKLRVRNRTEKGAPYKYLPLSAAIRVSQRDVDEGRVHEGSIHEAIIFSYDATGDGGSPLLTMALNSKNQVSHRLKELKSVKYAAPQVAPQAGTGSLELDLKDLKAGDGPFEARVLSISNKSGAAFVDCNVGRSQGKQHGGGKTRVLGMLRFSDMRTSRGASTSRSKMSDEEAQLLEAALLDEHDKGDDFDGDDTATLQDLFDDEDEEEEEENDITYELPDDEDAATDEELKELLSLFRGELSEDEASTLEMAIASESADDNDVSSDDDVQGPETAEDITHMFQMNDDGISYQDPETGETVLIEDSNEDLEEDSDEDDDEDDEFDSLASLSPEERLDAVAKLMLDSDDEDEGSESGDDTDATEQATELENVSYDPRNLKAGDSIQVYIKAVSKQSGRFMVTTDPAIKGRKAKDIKKEHEAEKKLSRLAAKFGGDKGLEKIMSLAGTECDGIVKATSNTGDWFYVQPDLLNLPVGVAAPSDDSTESSAISQGDTVRVRLDGIDESRGQLAMTVLEKLAP